MKQLKKWIGTFGVIATLAVPLAVAPMQALAQGTSPNPFTQAVNLANGTANAAGITGQQDLPTIIGRIINIALGFLGIVFLVLLLYAGFEWMTAQGDEAKVKKARSMITQAIIGLIIIVAAFAISNFVLSSLVNVTSQ
ncbi:MAG: pilin [Patescibacteria group bacterium]